MYLNEMYEFLENCLLLRLVLWEFQVDIPVTLVVLEKMVQTLCQHQCVWILALMGKRRCEKREVWCGQEQGLTSSLLPPAAGCCFHSPLDLWQHSCFEGEQTVGITSSVFISFLKSNRDWRLCEEENIEVNIIS